MNAKKNKHYKIYKEESLEKYKSREDYYQAKQKERYRKHEQKNLKHHYAS
jgi:hypothetical protein